MGERAQKEPPTCDAAEEAQGGRVAAVLVDHAAGGRLRHWDRQSDGLMEFATPRLHRDDGRDGHSIAQKLNDQLRLDGLGLCGCERRRGRRGPRVSVSMTSFNSDCLGGRSLITFPFARSRDRAFDWRPLRPAGAKPASSPSLFSLVSFASLTFFSKSPMSWREQWAHATISSKDEKATRKKIKNGRGKRSRLMTRHHRATITNNSVAFMPTFVIDQST